MFFMVYSEILLVELKVAKGHTPHRSHRHERGNELSTLNVGHCKMYGFHNTFGNENSNNMAFVVVIILDNGGGGGD